jgi:hypothetical protein
MVFFALTRSGYEDFERHIGIHASVTLWVNKDVLSDSELKEVRAAGLSVTDFTRMIDILDGVAVDEAVDTIKQHHPNECVWLER